MKVLLINPNNFQLPPVPPLGLEYVAGELEACGHKTAVLDLCFCDDHYEAVDEAVAGFSPDIAGLTVRNVDTVLYPGCRFLLDPVRLLIAHLKARHSLGVVVGGAGVSVDAGPVLAYLGADAAVEGACEGIASEAFEAVLGGQAGGVFRRCYSYNLQCRRKSAALDYGRYFRDGGIAGFETHRGCSSSCIYCTEAGSHVSFRRPSEVVSEIRALVDAGFGRFHLCDSEFNEDVDHALEFLKELKASGVAIDWTAYLKPANHNRKMFQLLRETGASIVTLTVDSWKKCPLYWDDIEKMIFSARSNGITVVVDFLTGFPYEEDDVLDYYLDLFRRLQPDRVVVNTHIRLYRRLRITEMIERDPKLRTYILPAGADPQSLQPVFFNRIDQAQLREKIKGEKMFSLAGDTEGVNYMRK